VAQPHARGLHWAAPVRTNLYIERIRRDKDSDRQPQYRIASIPNFSFLFLDGHKRQPPRSIFLCRCSARISHRRRKELPPRPRARDPNLVDAVPKRTEHHASDAAQADFLCGRSRSCCGHPRLEEPLGRRAPGEAPFTSARSSRSMAVHRQACTLGVASGADGRPQWRQVNPPTRMPGRMRFLARGREATAMMQGECRHRRFLERCLDVEGQTARRRPLAAPSLASRTVCVAASNRGRGQCIAGRGPRLGTGSGLCGRRRVREAHHHRQHQEWHAACNFNNHRDRRCGRRDLILFIVYDDDGVLKRQWPKEQGMNPSRHSFFLPFAFLFRRSPEFGYCSLGRAC
jgi:hypothetical protein